MINTRRTPLVLALVFPACVSSQDLGEPQAATSDRTSTSADSDPSDTEVVGESSGDTVVAGESGTDTEGPPSASDVGSCDEPLSDALGCSFSTAIHRDSEPQETRALWLHNDSSLEPISVSLTVVDLGGEDFAPDTFVLQPLEEVQWDLPIWPDGPGDATHVRSGGFVRISSVLPIRIEQALEQPSPGSSRVELTPDRLLPSSATLSATTDSFAVLVPTDPVTLQWEPTATTAGSGLPVAEVPAGEVGSMVMNPGEVLRLSAAAAGETLDGTVVTADGPIVCLGCD